MANVKKPKPADKPKLGWMTRTAMIASLGIDSSAFVRWGVKPVQKIGNKAYYTMQDVLQNRLDNERDKFQRAADKGVTNNGKINGAEEKALLDRAKRVSLETKNEKAAGELLPVVVAELVFAQMGAEVSAILDPLPGALKRLMPTMTATQVDLVRKEIARAKNTACDTPTVLKRIIRDIK